MAPTDLVTLVDVKAYIGRNAPADDGKTQRLITALSRSMLTAINRPSLLPTVYNERRDGNGHGRGVMLRQWPVISVNSVSLLRPSQTSILAGNDPYAGYSLDADIANVGGPGAPQMLYGPFPRGDDNLLISYTAGYQASDATEVPLAGTAYQVQAPFGSWASDQGVTFIGGAPLVAVTGTPSQGQYSAAGGGYTFSAADAGAPVLISYGYVPADLANALLEWIVDRLAYSERVGVKSRSEGGQTTVSYVVTDVPVFVKMAMADYTSVVPI